MLCDDELWTSFAYNLEKLMNEYNDVICLAFLEPAFELIPVNV